MEKARRIRAALRDHTQTNSLLRLRVLREDFMQAHNGMPKLFSTSEVEDLNQTRPPHDQLQLAGNSLGLLLLLLHRWMLRLAGLQDVPRRPAHAAGLICELWRAAPAPSRGAKTTCTSRRCTGKRWHACAANSARRAPTCSRSCCGVSCSRSGLSPTAGEHASESACQCRSAAPLTKIACM